MEDNKFNFDCPYRDDKGICHWKYEGYGCIEEKCEYYRMVTTGKCKYYNNGFCEKYGAFFCAGPGFCDTEEDYKNAMKKAWGALKEREIEECVEERDNGCILRVEVIAGAKESRIVGYDKQRRRLRVKVAKERRKGAANAELLKVIADTLRVKRKNVEIMHGHRTREKDVMIRGVKPWVVVSSIARQMEK